MRAIVFVVVLSSCALDQQLDEGETSQELGATVTLRAYYNPTTQDHALTTNTSFSVAGYAPQSPFAVGRIFSPTAPQPPNTMPLYTWYGAARGDYMTTTNPYWAGGPGDAWNNYEFVRLEGYVYVNAVAESIPLQMFWSATRADNRTTTDPMLTVDSTRFDAEVHYPDYRFARNEGYVLPPIGGYATASQFKAGEMGGGPTGERTMLVLRLEYADAPFRHSHSQIDNLMFGPDYPNVREYTSSNSQGRFTWRRGFVIGPFPYLDDPDTTNDESSFHEAWQKGYSDDIVFLSLRSYWGAAVTVQSDTLVTTGNLRSDGQATMGLVDHNGGDLLSGDRVSFKTLRGKYLREFAGIVVADATAPSVASAQWYITTSVPGPIRHDTPVILRNVATGRYLREVHSATEGDDERLITTATIEAWENAFTLEKAYCPDIQRQAQMAITRAALSGHDFRRYDLDGDNRIERSELGIAIVHSAPRVDNDLGFPILFHDGGATRQLADIVIPLTNPPLVLAGPKVVSVGEDTSFMTLAHEITHLLDAIDLYGDSENNYMSTMGATIFDQIDNRWTFMLDAWHRMRLGWVDPDIRALNTSGGISYQLAPKTVGNRPLILYDPRRYDVSTKEGEYFIVEFRSNRLPGYDTSAARYTDTDHGIAIWQIKDLPDDGTVRVLKPAANQKLWTSADSWIAPEYEDGTDSGFRLRVTPTTNTSTHAYVEWTNDSQLRPWIENGPATARAGSLVNLTGSFPVDSTGLSYRAQDAAGTWHVPTVHSTSTRLVQMWLPAIPNGATKLYVINNGEWGNGHVVTVTP